VSGRIAQRTIDAVRERAELVELVEARVGPGRRSAGQVMTRCPFHDERTPSFHIQPLDKLYICFGCGERGGLFDFVQKIENVTFPEAIEWLAERYGIDVEYDEQTPTERVERDRSRRVDALLEEVAHYYQRYLERAGEADDARAYIASRGISSESSSRFRIGFAPSDWDRVARAAQKKGYTPHELLNAGVSSQGRRGPIDRFRRRIVFPLCDRRGRVRGFGARVMPGGDGPKYLNSPESEVFKKGSILYGLHLARPAITRAGQVIVVEGYTDVVLLNQAGFEHTVAAMGTSLTEEQVRELRRLCANAVLCFDADLAGQQAALRGMEIAERAGMRVQVAALPAGTDPADIALADPAAFSSTVERAESVLSFRIGRALARVDADGADAAYQQARSILSQATAGPERDQQVRRVAGTLRLRADTAAALVPLRGPAPPPQRTRSRVDRRIEMELDLLGACLADPQRGTTTLTDELVGLLRDPEARELVGWVRTRLTGDPDPPPSHLSGVAAAVTSRSGQFDDPASALPKLVIGIELADTEDRIASLKETLRTDEYTPEDLATLSHLERDRAQLRDRLLRDAD
jgi:DNA primase